MVSHWGRKEVRKDELTWTPVNSLLFIRHINITVCFVLFWPFLILKEKGFTRRESPSLYFWLAVNLAKKTWNGVRLFKSDCIWSSSVALLPRRRRRLSGVITTRRHKTIYVPTGSGGEAAAVAVAESCCCWWWSGTQLTATLYHWTGYLVSSRFGSIRDSLAVIN